MQAFVSDILLRPLALFERRPNEPVDAAAIAGVQKPAQQRKSLRIRELTRLLG